MARLAVVPARGGSKRIPRKNIRNFRGKPLVAWPILTALESGVFNDVIVSTDDPEIAEVTTSWGATVPFERPAVLADDLTATAPVVAHAIEQMANLGMTYSEVCCLYPAAVFVSPKDLVETAALAAGLPTDVVVATVVRYSHPIQRALLADDRGYLQPLDVSAMSRRSQDIQESWHDAGQFYWATPETWLNGTSILNRVLAHELPYWRVQDIDTEEDWRRAELIHELSTTNVRYHS